MCLIKPMLSKFVYLSVVDLFVLEILVENLDGKRKKISLLPPIHMSQLNKPWDLGPVTHKLYQPFENWIILM